MKKRVEKMCLADFVENPDNPQKVSCEAFDRLVGKLKRVPDGLEASRIAYVTDHSAGPRVVISGNKRLRALKIIYGERGEVPAEWFQDVTNLTQDQRDEFIIDANVVEGRFDAKKMLELYDQEELSGWMGADALGKLIDTVGSSAVASEAASTTEVEPPPPAELVKFQVELTSGDYEFVVESLREINSDISRALVEVCCA